MIGADPELFFKRGDKFISSIGKIGGTKTEPRRLLGDFALQEDNVTVEYNIPACKSQDEFVWANSLMLDEINRIAKQYDCESVIESSAEFTNDELEDPAARVFGCDPDFNAWDLEPNPRPQCDNPNLRSAGGHIHLGMEKATNKDKISAIRTLDLILGVPLAFMDPESKRRELYGRAGACRFKPYGVEYRTPSNVWLRDVDLMSHTGYIAMQVGSKSFAKHYTDIANKEEEAIKAALNTLDENAYLHLENYFSDVWPRGMLNKIKLNKERNEAIKLKFV
jgi:hypothetical protein